MNPLAIDIESPMLMGGLPPPNIPPTPAPREPPIIAPVPIDMAGKPADVKAAPPKPVIAGAAPNIAGKKNAPPRAPMPSPAFKRGFVIDQGSMLSLEAMLYLARSFP